MAEPTVAEILKQGETPPVVRKFPPWLVVGSFFVFPPLCFALMWADPSYHKNLRIYLYLFGGLFAFYALSLLFTLSRLSGVYKELNITSASNMIVTDYFLVFLLLLFGAALAVFGYFYKFENKTQVAIAALALIISNLLIGVLVGLLVLSIILPIYNASTNFGGL